MSHETASLAGHLGLGKLVWFYDDNSISIDGPTSLSYSDNVPQRFEAYHWHVQTIDGHDMDAIEAAFAGAERGSDRLITRSHGESPGWDFMGKPGAIPDFLRVSGQKISAGRSFF